MDTPDTRAITLRLDADLYRKIKLMAVMEDKPAAQWMREALALVVEKVEEQGA